MEELFDYIFINKGGNINSSSYVVFDEESFKNICIKKIIKDFESKDSPGKHDGDLLTEDILNLHKFSENNLLSS